MKKEKCGCLTRKITKSEIPDYPKGTMIIVERFCEKHKQKSLKGGKK